MSWEVDREEEVVARTVAEGIMALEARAAVLRPEGGVGEVVMKAQTREGVVEVVVRLEAEAGQTPGEEAEEARPTAEEVVAVLM